MQTFQSLGGIAALGLGIYGFVAGGWLGALTGVVTGMAVFSGMAIMLGEQGTGVDDDRTLAGKAQRFGGLIGGIAALVGAYIGGWRWGWGYAIGGYVLGMLTSLGVGLISNLTRS